MPKLIQKTLTHIIGPLDALGVAFGTWDITNQFREFAASIMQIMYTSAVKQDFEVYKNVWDAIEPDPVKAENLKLRSSLMSDLIRHIRREGLTQTQAAKVFGVTQPRISNLIHGRIDLFALDILVKMATAAGLRVTMRVKKAA